MPQTELIPAFFRDGAQRMAQALRAWTASWCPATSTPTATPWVPWAAAGHIWRAMGKEFILYSSTGLPQYLKFFPLPGTVRTSLRHLPFTPHSALLLDCGEPHRLGSELADRLPRLTSVNIDHHLGGNGMAAWQTGWSPRRRPPPSSWPMWPGRRSAARKRTGLRRGPGHHHGHGRLLPRQYQRGRLFPLRASGAATAAI